MNSVCRYRERPSIKGEFEGIRIATPIVSGLLTLCCHRVGPLNEMASYLLGRAPTYQ